MIQKRVIAVNREEYEENARQEKLEADLRRAKKRSLHVERRELRSLDNRMRRKPAKPNSKRKD
jgi:hypothetical protein